MLVARSAELSAGCVWFAAVLRARRITTGLTQQQLAQRAGVGVRTVRELERARVGRPQRTTLELLADALELTGSERAAFTLGPVPTRRRIYR